jgi:hypothetical protein
LKFLVRYGLLGTVVCCYCLLTSLGCTKEFSYEFRPITDSIVLPDSVIDKDSIPVIPVKEPPCSNCDSLMANFDYTWQFSTNKKTYCGRVLAAYINYERNGFTFFGPSFCAKDSGIVIDAFFAPYSLHQNELKIQVNRVNFQYYDPTIPNQIVSSWTPHPFKFSVDNYERVSNIATGRFNGFAFLLNGDSVKVENGYYRVKFDD